LRLIGSDTARRWDIFYQNQKVKVKPPQQKTTTVTTTTTT